MKRILTIIIALLSILSSLAQGAKISGRVINEMNNEAIPFANVLLTGTNIGTSTSIDGTFHLDNVPLGFVTLTITSVGFEKKITEEFMVTNAVLKYEEVKMKEEVLAIQEVKITSNAFKRVDESPLSMRNIGIAEIENSPGSNRDISKVIQSFPGVAFTSVNRNDIIVRGGAPNESKFYLDEIEIPNINHFATQGASGGSNGILNADLIREVDFYSGAFPANRSNALSGVFNFGLIDGNANKQKIKGTIGASEIGLTADGPLGKNTTYILSIRRSYLQFLFQAIGLPFLPTYNDVQFKTRTKINDKNEIKLIGVGALDQSLLNLTANKTEQQQYILSYLPEYYQWSYTIGAVYKHYAEKSYQTIVLSRNVLNNESNKYQNNQHIDSLKLMDYKSQEIENKIRFEHTIRQNTVKYTLGLNLEYDQYTNATYQKMFIANQLAIINYNSLFDMYRWGLSAQASKSFIDDKLSVSLGIRSDATNYSSSMQNLLNQISPRISVSYKLLPSLSLVGNTGIYYETPAYTSLGYRVNNDLVNKQNDLKFIKVNHYIAGFEYYPSEMSMVSIEGFYKQYSNYPFALNDSISIANKGNDFGVVGAEPVKSISEGRAYGAEFLFRHRNLWGFNIVLSYTYVISEFTDKKGIYTPSTWDNRNLLILTTSKKFANNWKLGFKWRYAGGLPYTPYDMNKSELVSAWNTQGKAFLDYNLLDQKRLPAFHQLDLRVDKTYYFAKWTMVYYLDIQNLYNFKSIQPDIVLLQKNSSGQPIIVNPNDPANIQKYQLKSLASTSGLILPTIGVIAEF